MMTNTQALRAILARVGSFTGMLKEHIQLANNPLYEGKPFEPPEKEIWSKITVSNAGKFITGMGDKPCTRTTALFSFSYLHHLIQALMNCLNWQISGPNTWSSIRLIN